MRELKKWNWTLFFVIMIASFGGALSNKTIPDIGTGFIFALIFGIPIGLLWAWISKDIN